MIANKGELDGVRLLSPASVEMMGTNMIPASALVASNGNGVARFNEAVGFGLDFMVVIDPRAAGTLEGKGSMSFFVVRHRGRRWQPAGVVANAARRKGRRSIAGEPGGLETQVFGG
jgi:hypothetical protein